jgi:hypothetical protein
VSKYGAVPTTVDGHRFASAAEARRYGELKLLAQANVIRDLELQPRFPIEMDGKPVLVRGAQSTGRGRPAVYTADFRYVEVVTGQQVVEDVKGADTDGSRLRRALVAAQYGIEIRCICKPRKTRIPPNARH